MLSHCNCSSKTEESNKTCLQIVNHSGRLLQTGPNLTLKVTAPLWGRQEPLTAPCFLGRGCAVVQPRPLPNGLERRAAIISRVSSPARVPGGHRESARVGSGGRWGGSLRPLWLGREGAKAAQGGEVFFLVRGWRLPAKEQKYHEI